ncbi:DUF1192 domain-containing protein [Parvibaculaceae bacterium PLY_AMNH_Bact1]|nr:DUF1192 domain-containing protein [Parvibaculaceae bacterium PLY_AMNH_Bact1]
MDSEDLEPKRVPDSLQALAKEDISLLGVDELKERITLLTDEIARSKAMVASKQGSLSEAEAIFRK